MYDGRCQQNPDALQQVSHHMNEGCPDAGVTVAMVEAFVFVSLRSTRAVAVAVWGSRLVQDQHHPVK